MHVPEPRLHTVRYYGRYSNVARTRSRDRRKETTGAESPDGAGAESDTVSAGRRLRRQWAQMIRRIYEVDPLRCVHCGSEIGTRRRRRRGGRAAPSGAKLWANPLLPSRSSGPPQDPPPPRPQDHRRRGTSPAATARAPRVLTARASLTEHLGLERLGGAELHAAGPRMLRRPTALPLSRAPNPLLLAPHRPERATRLFQSPYQALLYPATLTQAESNPLSLGAPLRVGLSCCL